MMQLLATLAPQTVEHDGQIARSQEHYAIRGAGFQTQQEWLRPPQNTWSARAEDFDSNPRGTLSALGKSASLGALIDASRHHNPEDPGQAFGDSSRTWLLSTPCKESTAAPIVLPLLPARKAHPQTFREALVFTRPKQWSPWWDEAEGGEAVEGEEDDEGADESEAQKTVLAAAVAEKEDKETTRRKHRLKKAPLENGDPESLWSPFALQARRYGADVTIAGKRLRPSTADLFKYKFELVEPEPEWHHMQQRSSAAAVVLEAESTSAPSGMARSSSDGKIARRNPWRTPGVKPPAAGRLPRQRGQAQVHATAAAPPQAAPPPQPPAQPMRAERLRRPGSDGGVGRSVLLTEVGLDAEEVLEKPRLKHGPAGPWSSNAKLSIVRDLLDGYAADPLGGGPAGRSRPASSSAADFLERYVERQAEIERLLDERRAGVISAGPSVQSAPF
mmetsp:Transcript_18406/g.51149  ORF Transcript_18406/g.51149 Transcript_18406/m.51149 type:complete len:446 (+) Transcript_18406:87-1424(+)